MNNIVTYRYFINILSLVFLEYLLTSILHSVIQSYVVARPSYDGCSLSYDQSWKIADSRRLSYDGRTMVVQQSATCIRL